MTDHATQSNHPTAVNVAVIGGSGYAGGELLRLLEDHPVFHCEVVAGHSTVGKRIAEVFPHLGLPGTIADAGLDVVTETVAGTSVVFLATPHAASLALAPVLLASDHTVVDLSGSFRLDAERFSEYYGLDHTAPELTPGVYGLPEINRAALAGASLIAGPGCYPTAALLALAPLAGIIDPHSVSLTGMSGWSGAGRGLRDDLHAAHATGNVTAYTSPGHRHTPEIERHWQELSASTAAIGFTPHLVPQARGMVVTLSAELGGFESNPAYDFCTAEHDLAASYHDAYNDEPFVTVLEGDAWPQSGHVTGSNSAHVAARIDRHSGRVIASCAIDNLVKGAAGQAIQAANAALGLDETLGLPRMGLYP